MWAEGQGVPNTAFHTQPPLLRTHGVILQIGITVCVEQTAQRNACNGLVSRGQTKERKTEQKTQEKERVRAACRRDGE